VILSTTIAVMPPVEAAPTIASVIAVMQAGHIIR
jgi:hypothetical protein